jgi:hypothetical protein
MVENSQGVLARVKAFGSSEEPAGIAGTVSMAQYASELTKSGQALVFGGGDTLWVRSETFAMIRFPTFHLTPPSPNEVSRALWKGPAAVVSYLTRPDDAHPSSTWLYLCEDQSYHVEKLSKAARRDARRALRNLSIGPVEWSVLLEKGSRAYTDTLARLRLSNSSAADFRRHYGSFAQNRFHQVIGAWKDDTLVGFMTLFVVGDWVEVEGSFFSEADKGLCPSNGLAHYVLDHFLAQRKFRTVSYGMSSVQEENGHSGLHAYKMKVGFEARPAHRVFVLHPFLQPFVNRLTLKGLTTVLRLLPTDRRIRKAEGVLASLLRENRGVQC